MSTTHFMYLSSSFVVIYEKFESINFLETTLVRDTIDKNKCIGPTNIRLKLINLKLIFLKFETKITNN